MSTANPFTREFWVEPEPEPSNVVAFKPRDTIAQARYSAIAVEQDRATFDVTPNREEERRLWSAYMAAIRESVSAQERVNQAHNAWMGYAEKVTS